MNDRIVEAWLAQLVERSYVKRKTRGSSPGPGLHFSVIKLNLYLGGYLRLELRVYYGQYPC